MHIRLPSAPSLPASPALAQRFLCMIAVKFIVNYAPAWRPGWLAVPGPGTGRWPCCGSIRRHRGNADAASLRRRMSTLWSIRRIEVRDDQVEPPPACVFENVFKFVQACVTACAPNILDKGLLAMCSRETTQNQ